MIEPEIKGITAVDPKPAFPDEPACVLFLVDVGIKGNTAQDQFQLVVCNPPWLAEQVKHDTAYWPRYHLVVDEIHEEHVRDVVQSLIEQIPQRESWEAFARSLERFMNWEAVTDGFNPSVPRRPRSRKPYGP